MSHDLSQPIRTGWEKEISEKTDESTKEGINVGIENVFEHTIYVFSDLWTLNMTKKLISRFVLNLYLSNNKILVNLARCLV